METTFNPLRCGMPPLPKLPVAPVIPHCDIPPAEPGFLFPEMNFVPPYWFTGNWGTVGGVGGTPGGGGEEDETSVRQAVVQNTVMPGAIGTAIYRLMGWTGAQTGTTTFVNHFKWPLFKDTKLLVRPGEEETDPATVIGSDSQGSMLVTAMTDTEKGTSGNFQTSTGVSLEAHVAFDNVKTGGKYWAAYDADGKQMVIVTGECW